MYSRVLRLSILAISFSAGTSHAALRFVKTQLQHFDFAAQNAKKHLRVCRR